MKCPQGCKSCLAPNICSSCDEGWTLNKKNRCLPTGASKCDSGMRKLVLNFLNFYLAFL